MSRARRDANGAPDLSADQVGLPPPTFARPLPDEPEAITAAFIADYKEWNDFAFASCPPGAGCGPALESYDRLIEKYCRPGKQHLLPAFGSHSFHSPETSEVVAVRGRGNRKTVTVRETRSDCCQQTDEFDFVRHDGRWWLDEMYFIDEDDGNRRLEGL